MKAEKLRGILIDHKLDTTEQLADTLEDRVEELEVQHTECVEDGDNIYQQIREEMKNQLITEQGFYN